MVAEAPSIHIKDLTYNFPDGSAGLQDINVDLPPGSRTLLIGGMYAYGVFSSPLPLGTLAARGDMRLIEREICTDVHHRLANGAGKTTLLRLASGEFTLHTLA